MNYTKSRRLLIPIQIPHYLPIWSCSVTLWLMYALMSVFSLPSHGKSSWSLYVVSLHSIFLVLFLLLSLSETSGWDQMCSLSISSVLPYAEQLFINQSEIIGEHSLNNIDTGDDSTIMIMLASIL